jgi:hypothetical protein
MTYPYTPHSIAGGSKSAFLKQCKGFETTETPKSRSKRRCAPPGRVRTGQNPRFDAVVSVA